MLSIQTSESPTSFFFWGGGGLGIEGFKKEGVVVSLLPLFTLSSRFRRSWLKKREHITEQIQWPQNVSSLKSRMTNTVPTTIWLIKYRGSRQFVPGRFVGGYGGDRGQRWGDRNNGRADGIQNGWQKEILLFVFPYLCNRVRKTYLY